MQRNDRLAGAGTASIGARSGIAGAGTRRQVQQGLGSFLRQALRDVEQGVLVGSLDLIKPLRRHTIAEQGIVGDPSEQ